MGLKRFVAQIIDQVLSLMVGVVCGLPIFVIPIIIKGGGHINLAQLGQTYSAFALVFG